MRTRHVGIFGSTVVALSAAWAATLEVSKEPGAPYSTIQSAIDAAVPNVDEVWVRCGRYPENIVMRSGVPVRGENPLCAFVDGRGLGPVVRMTDLSATKLSGLTIENGLDIVGGGVRILRGSPIIEGNRIRNNRSTATYLYQGGGGIGVDYSSPYPSPVITRNVITGNEADFVGAMMLLSGTGGRIEGNLIADNGGDYAVWLEQGAGKFLNNTIVRTRRGAGLGMYDNFTAVIGSNVIANNPIGMEGYGASAFTIAGNDVWGNGVDYGGQLPDLTGTSGNISADPRFVDENWESFLGFEPRSDSPLVEASWSTANATTELSGIAAPVDGRCTGAPKRDIGARENEGITRVRFGSSKDTLLWDPGNHVPNDYNVFRGDLATLKATGVYTQNPATVAGAAKFCDVGPFSLGDPAIPDPEAGWYYLVAGWGTTQGPLGFNSARQPRPYGTTCP